MGLGLFKERSARKAMEEAKAAYLKATKISGVSRESHMFKTRIGARSRAHLDKVFIEGAEQATAYQELCLAAMSAGSERPQMPEPKPFQTVKSQKDIIYTYVPSEFAKEMFMLGTMYQTVAIGPQEAIKMAQAVADKVSMELGLDDPFQVLQFLRDELAREDAPDDSDESNLDQKKEIDSN